MLLVCAVHFSTAESCNQSCRQGANQICERPTQAAGLQSSRVTAGNTMPLVVTQLYKKYSLQHRELAAPRAESESATVVALQNMYGQPLPYGSMPVAPPGMHYGFPPHHAAVRAVSFSANSAPVPAVHAPLSAEKRHRSVSGGATCARPCTAAILTTGRALPLGRSPSHKFNANISVCDRDRHMKLCIG